MLFCRASYLDLMSSMASALLRAMTALNPFHVQVGPFSSLELYFTDLHLYNLPNFIYAGSVLVDAALFGWPTLLIG